MFQTTLTNLIILYLFFLIGGVAVLWIYGVWVRRRRERKALERFLLCRICGETFEIDPSAVGDLATCCHCGSLNEKERYRAI